jgi:hypothetical protein
LYLKANPRAVLAAGFFMPLETTMTTPAPAERRVRPRARRAQLPETDTGLITRDAFARQHGITKHTLGAWVRRGLPFVKICGLMYFRVETAREWIAAQERTAAAEKRR